MQRKAQQPERLHKPRGRPRKYPKGQEPYLRSKRLAEARKLQQQGNDGVTAVAQNQSKDGQPSKEAANIVELNSDTQFSSLVESSIPVDPVEVNAPNRQRTSTPKQGRVIGTHKETNPTPLRTRKHQKPPTPKQRLAGERQDRPTPLASPPGIPLTSLDPRRAEIHTDEVTNALAPIQPSTILPAMHDLLTQHMPRAHRAHDSTIDRSSKSSRSLGTNSVATQTSKKPHLPVLLVTINPPGSAKPSGGKRGRPKKCMVAVFKFERLRELKWFETPVLTTKRSLPITANETNEVVDAEAISGNAERRKRCQLDVSHKDNRDLTQALDLTSAETNLEDSQAWASVNESASRAITNLPTNLYGHHGRPALTSLQTNWGDTVDATGLTGDIPCLDVSTTTDCQQAAITAEPTEDQASETNVVGDMETDVVPSDDTNSSDLHIAASRPSNTFGDHVSQLSDNEVQATDKPVRKDQRKATSSTKYSVSERGSISFKRKQIIFDLVDKAGGVFPGDKELWYPFSIIWIGQNKGCGTPDTKTVKRIQKDLVDSGQLKSLKFFYLNSKGLRMEKKILTRPHISPDSILVKNLEQKMKEHESNLYIPPEAGVSEEARKRFDMSNAVRGGHLPQVNITADPAVKVQLFERPVEQVPGYGLPPRESEEQRAKRVSEKLERAGLKATVRRQRQEQKAQVSARRLNRQIIRLSVNEQRDAAKKIRQLARPNQMFASNGPPRVARLHGLNRVGLARPTPRVSGIDQSAPLELPTEDLEAQGIATLSPVPEESFVSSLISPLYKLNRTVLNSPFGISNLASGTFGTLLRPLVHNSRSGKRTSAERKRVRERQVQNDDEASAQRRKRRKTNITQPAEQERQVLPVFKPRKPPSKQQLTQSRTTSVQAIVPPVGQQAQPVPKSALRAPKRTAVAGTTTTEGRGSTPRAKRPLPVEDGTESRPTKRARIRQSKSISPPVSTEPQFSTTEGVSNTHTDNPSNAPKKTLTRNPPKQKSRFKTRQLTAAPILADDSQEADKTENRAVAGNSFIWSDDSSFVAYVLFYF